jgi:dipeptidase E
LKLLLLSTSRIYGSGYLDYCADAIVSFLGPTVKRVLFVPYAMRDRDAYAATARARYEQLGLALESIHDVRGGPVGAVDSAEAIFVGGGNTFRLLNALYRENLLEPIRRHVLLGTPYIGSSAGSNIVCPTIKTTNDMPIVQPPSFVALNLVSFQINPHYLDPIPGSTHMGETREERIREFLEENDTPVVGLREGAWLQVDGATINLRGPTGARIFRRGQQPVEAPAGSQLNLGA